MTQQLPPPPHSSEPISSPAWGAWFGRLYEYVRQGNKTTVERITINASPGVASSSPTTTTTSGPATQDYVAGQVIAPYRMLAPDANGKAIYADATNSAHVDVANQISTAATPLGGTATAQIDGKITNPAWSWTPGATLYLGTAGQLTATVPVISGSVFSKPVAVAETATTIQLISEAPVSLVSGTAAKKFLRLVSGKITEILGVVVSAGAANAGDIVALNASGQIDSSMLPATSSTMLADLITNTTVAAGNQLLYMHRINLTGTLTIGGKVGVY